MDLLVAVFQKGCDHCAWWAAEADRARQHSGWFTIPKALLDHLEAVHGIREIAVIVAPEGFSTDGGPRVTKLREVTGR